MKRLAPLILLLALCAPAPAPAAPKWCKVFAVPAKIVWKGAKYPMGFLLRAAVFDKNGQVYEAH